MVEGAHRRHPAALRGDRHAREGGPAQGFGKLTGKGETGFIDGQGVFRGPELPVSLDGPLPTVAVMMGPVAFQQGKDGALGTMRHEMNTPSTSS